MTVDNQVPVPPRRMRLVVAPAKSTDSKKPTATKGKSTAPLVTRPRARKVTRVTSPSPEAVVEELTRVQSPTPEAVNEALPAAGPSGSTRPSLFEAAALSGDEEVTGRGAVTPGGSSEYLVIVPLDS